MLIDFIGILGGLIIASSFSFKSDNRLLLVLSIGCLVYSIHFYLMGIYFASFLQIVTIVRLWISRFKKSLIIAHFFACIYFILLYCSWTSYLNLLTLIAVLISTYSTLLFSGIKMRFLLLIPSFLWLIHNFFVFSIGGIMLEFLVLSINSYTIHNLLKEQNIKNPSKY